MTLNESARASVSNMRGMPQKHWVIQDPVARGESKGSKHAAESQQQRQAQQEVASINLLEHQVRRYQREKCALAYSTS